MIEFFKALQIAIMAHHGQRRKYTEEPYIIHPVEVAYSVYKATGDVELTAAAVLHDVLEDTTISYDQLCNYVGETITNLVREVTDISKPSDGNRAERKRIDRQHYKTVSNEAKTIKLADIISNTRSIAGHDPDFAKIYLEEKRLLMPYLKGGHPILYNMAAEAVGYDDNCS